MNKCLVFVLFFGVVFAQDNGAMKVLRRVYTQCGQSKELYKCLKVQALRFADRAIKSQHLTLLDGINIVKTKSDGNERRSFEESANGDYNNLSSNKIDALLTDKASRFLETHKLELNVPRLISSSTSSDAGRMIEEARGKYKKFLGPFLAAVAIKGGFLAMAYQSIALLAGKALLVGKIALILSAIIGLKKLLSSEGHEKTTYEIVKHPQVSQSHTYSSDHASQYETSGSGGHYHRSLAADEDMLMQERAYRAYKPKSF